MEIETGLKGFAFGLAIFLTVSLNGLVIATFFMGKRPRFSTKCIHVLVTNLAVCQLLIGIVVIPFVEVSVFYDGWKQSRAVCQLNGFTTSTCFYTAVLMLCVISLDRYVAIVLATKYQRLLSRRRGYTIVVFVWFTASLLSMPPLIGWSSYQYHPGTLHCSPVWIGQCPYFYFTFAVSVIIPTSMTVFSYIVIFWRIRQHRKRVSMWKHTGKEDGGTINESGYELSQVPTVNKSPGILRKESIVTERQNDGNEAEINTLRHALTNNSNSPLLTTPVSKRTIPSVGLTEEQITVKENEYPENRDSSLQSGDIFYNPKGSMSPKLVGKFRAPMIVGDYQNGGQRESSPKIRESSFDILHGGRVNCKMATVEANDRWPVDARGCWNEDGYKLSRDEKGARSREGQTGNLKKLRIGHLLTMNRADKSVAMKLNDKDVNELLNLSEDSDAKSSTMMSSEGTSQTEENGPFLDEKKDARDTGYSPEVIGQQEKREINAGEAKIYGTRGKTMSLVPAISGNKKPNMAKNWMSIKRNATETKRVNRTLREFQVAKTGAILLAVFMVCYGPYTVVHLCHLPFPVPYEAQYFAMWCVFLNSILTPIIYGIMNKETRKRIKQVLRKCWNCCR